jgi:glycosyltransferase involved in cell wall biosynthesis
MTQAIGTQAPGTQATGTQATGPQTTGTPLPATPRRLPGLRTVFIVGTEVDSIGGSQRVLHTLAQGFAERGHRVRLIGLRPSPQPFAYNMPDRKYEHTVLYRHLTAAEDTPTAIKEARAGLTRLLRTGPDGYLIVGSPWAVDWVSRVDTGRLKVIGQYHESFLQAKGTIQQRLIEKNYARLDRSVFLSPGDVEEFRRLRLPNAGSMPNPLSFGIGAPAELSALRVGTVTRLDPIKRLDRLIDAFAEAAAELPGWELHLFGDGPEEERLRAYAQTHHVADRVVFRGRVADVQAAYRELSVVGFSSEREGWGLTVAESAACGVPSVAFDVSGGIRELVVDGRTGFLVKPADVHGFADRLRKLMEDQQLRRKFGAAAREHVAAFTLDAVLDRWEALFDDLDR